MSIFANSCETRELHSHQELRTRYYRNNFRQCVEAIKKYAEETALDVRNVNEDHKEIYLLGNGFDMIVTVTLVTPVEAGIDVKINTFTFIGLNRPKKKAVAFYQAMDKSLNFKGVSLHP